jgi:hypothetical protein
MASSTEEAARFALVSIPHAASEQVTSNLRRVIATYTSREQAHLARQALVRSIPHPSGYIEGEDIYWIAYGDLATDEVLLLIEPMPVD